MYLSKRKIQTVVGIINAIIAAGLLFGAIFNVYYVGNENRRLGLIAMFTTLFTLCLGFVTNTKGPAIFRACAANAAILVAIVGRRLSD